MGLGECFFFRGVSFSLVLHIFLKIMRCQFDTFFTNSRTFMPNSKTGLSFMYTSLTFQSLEIDYIGY